MKSFIAAFLIAFLFTSEGFCSVELSEFEKGLDILAKNNQIRRNNSCVQSFFYTKLEDSIYVYWPENRMLVIFPFFEKEDLAWKEPILISRIMNLESDVVLDVKDIGSSTYLASMSFVKNKIEACFSGDLFKIYSIVKKSDSYGEGND